MARIDWNKRRDEALQTLTENAKAFPLLKKAKPSVITRPGMPPKAVEKIKYLEQETETEAMDSIPYVKSFSDFTALNPDIWDKEYLFIASEDMPAALKCAVIAAGVKQLNEEAENDGFYFT